MFLFVIELRRLLSLVLMEVRYSPSYLDQQRCADNSILKCLRSVNISRSFNNEEFRMRLENNYSFVDIAFKSSRIF